MTTTDITIAREAQDALNKIKAAAMRSQIETALAEVGVKALYRVAVELNVATGHSRAKKPELLEIVVPAAWAWQEARMAEAEKAATRRTGEQIKADRQAERKAAKKGTGGTGGPQVKMTDDQVQDWIRTLLAAEPQASNAYGLAQLRSQGLSVAQARFRQNWQTVKAEPVPEGGADLSEAEAQEMAEADAEAQAQAETPEAEQLPDAEAPEAEAEVPEAEDADATV